MDRLRQILKILLYLASIIAFVHGMDEIRNGGGIVVGLALLSATILFVFDSPQWQKKLA